MVKILFLIGLLVSGCTNTALETEIASRLYSIDNKIAQIADQTKYVERKIEGPTNGIRECVIFEKKVDTHAVSEITIPVSGIYFVQTYVNETGTVGQYKAGLKIRGVKYLISDHCPDFEMVTRKL